MSHITKVGLKVRDLDALETAIAERFELRRDQKSHIWFGRFVGDTSGIPGVPEGEYGKCDHALRLKNHQAGDYEIGLRKATDGDGFDLVVDTWGQKRLLDATEGHAMPWIKREYAAAVAAKQAKAKLARKGFVTTRESLPNGRIRLRLRQR